MTIAPEPGRCEDHFSPGPAVVYTAAHAVTGGMRHSLFASAGVIFGNIVYFAISALAALEPASKVHET